MTAPAVLLAAMMLAAPCGLGEAARRAAVDGDGEIWVDHVARGEWELALVNRGERTISLDVVWTELGLPERVRVWGRTPRGRVHGGFAEKLAPGECARFRLRQ